MSEALAQRLSLEIEELARSLTAVGPLTPAGMRLLESAAVAAMHAVSLEELRHDPPARQRREEPPAPVSPIRRAA